MGQTQTAIKVRKPLSDIEIDYMRKSDLLGVMEIERQSFSDPWSERSFREGIKRSNPHVYFLVLRRNQMPIAFVNFWIVEDEAHIANFAVSPEYRRKGLGKYLLAQSLVFIRRHGGNIVTLEVRVSNIPAQNLYREFGFAVASIRKRYYTDNGEDAYIFRLDDLSDIDIRIEGMTTK